MRMKAAPEPLAAARPSAYSQLNCPLGGHETPVEAPILVKNLSQVMGSLVSLAAIAFFSVAGVRGCTVGVWRSPAEPALYRVAGADGRHLAILVLPSNRVVMAYTD